MSSAINGLPRPVAAALTAFLGVLVIGACSSSSGNAAAPMSAQPSLGEQSGAVHPIQGSKANTYVVGPFTVEMESGPTPEPSGSGLGYSFGVPVKITDSSNSYHGVAQPSIEFTSGSTVLGTNVSPISDPLAPGQSETVWVDYPDYPGTQGKYVVAQLVQFWYSEASGASGTTVTLLPN